MLSEGASDGGHRMTCDQCKWFVRPFDRELYDDYGVCHYSPPWVRTYGIREVPHPQDCDADERWPGVHEEEWCSFFKRSYPRAIKRMWRKGIKKCQKLKSGKTVKEKKSKKI